MLFTQYLEDHELDKTYIFYMYLSYLKQQIQAESWRYNINIGSYIIYMCMYIYLLYITSTYTI